jgi:hypothetical protein
MIKGQNMYVCMYVCMYVRWCKSSQAGNAGADKWHVSECFYPIMKNEHSLCSRHNSSLKVKPGSYMYKNKLLVSHL